MRYTFLVLPLLCLSFTARAAIFPTGVETSAEVPHAAVDANIYYSTVRAADGNYRPIQNCVLLHGPAVSPTIMAQFKRYDGKKLVELGSLDQAQIGRQLAGVANQLSPRIDLLGNLNIVSIFGSFYFGEALTKLLVREACRQVTVVVTESVQTNILEMTVRMERFLRDVACTTANSQSTWGCALIGHSKGGAVATMIARRCMEAQEPRGAGEPLHLGGSDLGKEGCKRLGYVYSAAGTVQGSGLAVTMYGGKIADEQRQSAAGSAIGKTILGYVDQAKMFEPGMKRLNLIKETQSKGTVDLIGEKRSNTNPFWFDLGPLALVDGEDPETGRRFTLGEKHGPGFVLKRAGWFYGSYIASAGDIDFSQKPVANMSCGLPARQQRPRLFAAGPPRPANGRRPLQDLIRGALSDAAGKSMPSPAGTEGTPIVDKLFSISDTPILDFLFDPFLIGQQLACDEFQKQILELHDDPSLNLSYVNGISGMKRYASQEKLTADDESSDYLDGYSFKTDEGAAGDKVVFQHSDGMVEAGSALGVCRRSQQVAKEENVVRDCRLFTNPALSHFGMTGMATAVADHIVSQLRIPLSANIRRNSPARY